MTVQNGAGGAGATAYDYIIVGAGSAGCVLAYRLSANPNVRVLLIEAGPPDNHPFIHMPRALVRMLGNSNYVWTYQADPAPGGRNDPHVWVRGKTLGGSSSINGMVYVRGQPQDYDDWARNGASGWNWSTMREAFRAIEDHELGPAEERGAGGPLHVSVTHTKQELCEAFFAAWRDLGVPTKADINEGDQVGAGYYPRTIKNGKRWSAARAFLKPARRRPNLRVLTRATVERVVFDGRCATGVACAGENGATMHHCSGEVILAAGGLNSPALLQLSGIGDEAHLRDVGISVRQHLPGVGENMREHWLLPLEFRLRDRGSTNAQYAGLRLVYNILRYAAFGAGPMTEASYEAGGFIKSDPALDRADSQLLFGPFTIDRARGFKIDRLPGAQCGGMVMRPESRGTVKITGADMRSPLQIKPNYMTADYDQQVAVRLYRNIRTVMSHPALAGYVKSQLSPSASLSTDDEILDAWRRQGVAGYHAAGACRLGNDPLSVVDTRLRVRGVNGLRVMDCSVMPTLVSGNTNGPVMAMAWRAADLILQDRTARGG